MYAEINGQCPNCEEFFEKEVDSCMKCGTPLERPDYGAYYEDEYQESSPQLANFSSDIIHQGNINCSCGQSFYFETGRSKVNCIKCDKEYDTTIFQVKNEIIIEEGE